MAILTPLFSIFEQILLKIVNFWPFFADLNAPYYLLRGGYLDDSSLNTAGSYGFYWSSTPDGSSDAYSLRSNSGGISAGLSGRRYYGRSVRCVAAG